LERKIKGGVLMLKIIGSKIMPIGTGEGIILAKSDGSPVITVTDEGNVEIDGHNLAGISDWEVSTGYKIGDLVLKDLIIYRCKEEHTSTAEFEVSKWDSLKNTATSIEVLDTEGNFTGNTVEAVLQELFQFADDGKTSWVEVVGSPLETTETFNQLKTKTQTIKNTIAANLVTKGVTAEGTETLTSLANKIDTIVTGGGGGEGVSFTKLDVTAPYNKEINLPGWSVEQVCANVIYYRPQEIETILEVAFNNGDSSDFEENTSIAFDGTMKIKASYVSTLIKTDLEGTDLYTSGVISLNAITDFKVDKVDVDNLVLEYRKLDGIPQIAIPKNFVNISAIGSIEKITLVATEGGGILRYAIDFGNGATVWNGSEWTAITLTPENMASSGMTISTVNGLTKSQLNTGRGENNSYKMYYYMSYTDLAVLEPFNNNKKLEVKALAVPELANKSNWNLSWNNNTKVLTVGIINQSGIYRINWVE
jgi:hypothetical protein